MFSQSSHLWLSACSVFTFLLPRSAWAHNLLRNMRYRKVKPAAMKVRLLELEWDLEVLLHELVVSLKYLPNSLECLTL